MTEEYLIHYGVKGMKWGVRRKLNSNGLIVAGKARDARTQERANQRKADNKADVQGVRAVVKGKKSFTEAGREHDQRTANRAAQKKAHTKANNQDTKAVAKDLGKKYMEKANAHEAKTKAKDAVRSAKIKKRLKTINDTLSKTLDTAVDIANDVSNTKGKMAMIDGVNDPALKMEIAKMIWDD